MRIAQVIPRGERPASGILTVVVHLAAALAARGHDVDVWKLHAWSEDEYAAQREVLGRATVREVEIHESIHRTARSVARLAEARNVDVVHLHGAFNVTNTAIALLLRRPYVLTPHGGYDPVSLHRSRTRKRMYLALLERRVLRKAAAVIALTDSERGDVLRLSAARACDVIPNGVDVGAPAGDGAMFRRDLGLEGDTPLAVFVGRVDMKRKGLDVLVRGIAGAPGWHAALVGPRFRGVPELERLIGALGVSDRVHLVGERRHEHLRDVWAAADVFTLMSRWEGMSMALLEGLASGTPAIVSAPVDRSIGVARNGAGWAVEDDALGTLLQNLDPRAEEMTMKGQAALRLASTFRWSAIADGYERAYSAALAVRHGA